MNLELRNSGKEQPECADCIYVREERAGIHEFMGGTSRAEAVELAKSERCPAHRAAFVIEVANMWNGTPVGPVEYVGRNRKSRLGNRFKIGVDGDRKKCVELYRGWLWEHVKLRDEVFEKLRELRARARVDGRLILLCHCAPQECHADVIAECLRWMEREGID